MVKKIEESNALEDEDRQRLLKAHEDNLLQVEQQLNDDKKRQANEMDRALKERLEKRKHRKKNLNKDDLKEDIAEETAKVNEEFADKKDALEAKLEEEHRSAQQSIYRDKEKSGSEQAEALRDLQKNSEVIKQMRGEELEDHRKATIEEKKK